MLVLASIPAQIIYILPGSIMAQAWDSHKDMIYDLYISQNKSLKYVRMHMKKQHGFDRRHVRVNPEYEMGRLLTTL